MNNDFLTWPTRSFATPRPSPAINIPWSNGPSYSHKELMAVIESVKAQAKSIGIKIGEDRQKAAHDAAKAAQKGPWVVAYRIGMSISTPIGSPHGTEAGARKAAEKLAKDAPGNEYIVMQATVSFVSSKPVAPTLTVKAL